MSIGVGIITCNRPDFFEKCHKSIKREWYDYLVVVNDGEDIDYKKNDQYHKSVWAEATDRKIKTALKNKLVNPISQHPTKESHSKIANLLYNELQSSASRNT